MIAGGLLQIAAFARVPSASTTAPGDANVAQAA